jgi:hypothetical protein
MCRLPAEPAWDITFKKVAYTKSLWLLFFLIPKKFHHAFEKYPDSHPANQQAYNLNGPYILRAIFPVKIIKG